MRASYSRPTPAGLQLVLSATHLESNSPFGKSSGNPSPQIPSGKAEGSSGREEAVTRIGRRVRFVPRSRYSITDSKHGGDVVGEGVQVGYHTRKHDGVDAALRGARPDASEELVAELSGRVLAASRRPSPRAHRGSRVAFALALSVFMLGTFASFGGLGYAATTQAQQSQKQSATADDCDDANGKQSAAGKQYCEEKLPDLTTVAPLTPPSASAGVAGQSTGPQAASDTLPFTGYGLGGTALVGSLLLALGVFFRRREARE